MIGTWRSLVMYSVIQRGSPRSARMPSPHSDSAMNCRKVLMPSSIQVH